jgi:fimbrial chaperone protein
MFPGASIGRAAASFSLGKNNGSSRFRLSDMTLAQGGTRIGSRSGLVGYVLGGATMQWPLGAAKSLSGGVVSLHGQSDLGPFDAKVAVNQR